MFIWSLLSIYLSQQKLWHNFNWKDGIFPVNFSFFSTPFFISNLDCWLNSHQEKKNAALICESRGERALHREERLENGKSRWIWKSSNFNNSNRAEEVLHARRSWTRADTDTCAHGVLMISLPLTPWLLVSWGQIQHLWNRDNICYLVKWRPVTLKSGHHVTRVRVLTRLKSVPIPFPSFLCCRFPISPSVKIKEKWQHNSLTGQFV